MEKHESMPHIRPASDLRTRFTEVMREIHEANEPVFFTRKGRGELVVMSAKTFGQYELTGKALRERYESKPFRGSDGGQSESGYVCRFCGKTQDEVQRMIIAPDSTICDECVEVCVRALKESPEDDTEE